MSRRRNNPHHERLPSFVPWFLETVKAPAWRAMSNGARVLYMQLKTHHILNNGHVYLSQRKAVEEMGSQRRCIAVWFRELQYYGFIVMTDPGGLGVNGKGKAPHWRLTELPTRAKDGQRIPATEDFKNWDGRKFKDRPRKPGGKKASTLGAKRHPPPGAKRHPLNGASGGKKASIQSDPPGGKKASITILATRYGPTPGHPGAQIDPERPILRCFPKTEIAEPAISRTRH